ncbi:MAG TPA: peptidase, partial [Thermoanaerobaculia bacterium]|nr:peptidase [Thermoanaerobaculia bacterium]
MRRAAAHAAALGLAALLRVAVPAGATTITIMNANAAGIGFNDPTPVVPVAGNAGTTLGQQRLNVFKAAAAYWSNRLVSSVPITVSAQMIPLDCTSDSALLGFAGPTDFVSDFVHAPRSATWYPSALANALASADQDDTSPEIAAQFNTRLDNVPTCLSGIHWYYGIGGIAPVNTLPFYQTVLHELAHGLGFLTIVDLATGALAQGQTGPPQ